ncbi:hypothetical protein PsorP6_000619 [Peronosclerospora sorghi]|uniref:Uncharacterized protein n=1 Tax=Peronosclerospora sorghi TaxID=230839 RepID=A0ACC0WPX3_9STRA|nr:hypothetical protein PsorP6_000619 [Peronosclerospora sorghi]
MMASTIEKLKLSVANATTGARGIRDPVLLVHEAHLSNVFRVNDEREVTQDGHGQSMLRERRERRLGGVRGPHDKDLGRRVRRIGRRAHEHGALHAHAGKLGNGWTLGDIHGRHGDKRDLVAVFVQRVAHHLDKTHVPLATKRVLGLPLDPEVTVLCRAHRVEHGSVQDTGEHEFLLPHKVVRRGRVVHVQHVAIIRNDWSPGLASLRGSRREDDDERPARSVLRLRVDHAPLVVIVDVRLSACSWGVLHAAGSRSDGHDDDELNESRPRLLNALSCPSEPAKRQSGSSLCCVARWALCARSASCTCCCMSVSSLEAWAGDKERGANAFEMLLVSILLAFFVWGMASKFRNGRRSCERRIKRQCQSTVFAFFCMEKETGRRWTRGKTHLSHTECGGGTWRDYVRKHLEFI